MVLGKALVIVIGRAATLWHISQREARHTFVKQECGGGFYKPPSSRRPYFNLLTNQSAIEISRSREGEGRTMSTRRFFAMLVRFSA